MPSISVSMKKEIYDLFVEQSVGEKSLSRTVLNLALRGLGTTPEEISAKHELAMQEPDRSEEVRVSLAESLEEEILLLDEYYGHLEAVVPELRHARDSVLLQKESLQRILDRWTQQDKLYYCEDGHVKEEIKSG